MNVRRITRLLHLVQELYSGGGQNADGLAKSCEISRRTVFRDIEALRAAGLPVTFDPEQDHYSLPNGYCLPPVNLEPAESLTLLVLAFEFGQSDGLPFFDAARSAAAKLELSFPRNLRDKFRRIRRGIEIRSAPPGIEASKREYYQHLVDARLAGQVLRIRYDIGTTSGDLTTKLRPYHLVFCRHSWYVIGRSSFHKGVRTFNLSRVMEVEGLDEKFALPANFKIEKYLRNAWLLMPENGPDYSVVIRFSPNVARNVSDVKWHKTQHLKLESDGSLVFHAQVSGLSEIVWWVLAYGDQAEVIRPAKLRQLVQQRARRMVEIYDSAQ